MSPKPKEAAIPLVRPRVGPILYNRPRGRQGKVTQISSQEVHKEEKWDGDGLRW